MVEKGPHKPSVFKIDSIPDFIPCEYVTIHADTPNESEIYRTYIKMGPDQIIDRDSLPIKLTFTDIDGDEVAYNVVAYQKLNGWIESGNGQKFKSYIDGLYCIWFSVPFEEE
jgi:hypothetical protein